MQGQNCFVTVRCPTTHNLYCTFVSVLIVRLHHLWNINLVVNHNMPLSQSRSGIGQQPCWDWPAFVLSQLGVCTGPLSSYCVQVFLLQGLAVTTKALISDLSDLKTDCQQVVLCIMLVLCLFFFHWPTRTQEGEWRLDQSVYYKNEMHCCLTAPESPVQFWVWGTVNCQSFACSPHIHSPILLQISWQFLKTYQ